MRMLSDGEEGEANKRACDQDVDSEKERITLAAYSRLD